MEVPSMTARRSCGYVEIIPHPDPVRSTSGPVFEKLTMYAPYFPAGLVTSMAWVAPLGHRPLYAMAETQIASAWRAGLPTGPSRYPQR
jgi:hypothetical protein